MLLGLNMCLQKPEGSSEQGPQMWKQIASSRPPAGCPRPRRPRSLWWAAGGGGSHDEWPSAGNWKLFYSCPCCVAKSWKSEARESELHPIPTFFQGVLRPSYGAPRFSKGANAWRLQTGKSGSLGRNLSRWGGKEQIHVAGGTLTLSLDEERHRGDSMWQPWETSIYELRRAPQENQPRPHPLTSNF